jgi:hypothetical protein
VKFFYTLHHHQVGGSGAIARKTKSVVATSAASAAKLLDVSERTFRTWLARGCPGGQGRYEIARIQEWRDNNIAPRGGSAASSSGDGSLASQKIAIEILERQENVRTKKLRNDLREGRLADVKEVQRQAAEMVTWIKDRLLAIPDELEMTFPAETRLQNKADVEISIRLILKKLSRFETTVSEVEDD